MTQDSPPVSPKPTKEDLAIFRQRLQAALATAGMSARALEKRIGMATGTLSKIYSGRTRLTLKTLREIADTLHVGPAKLVEETNLAHLLLGAPEPMGAPELDEARKEIDRLRGLLAEKEAVAESAAQDAASARAQSAQMQHELQARREQEAVLRVQLDNAVIARREAESKSQAIETERSSAMIEHDATRARLSEVLSAANNWRSFAAERQQRVAYLEGELQRIRAQFEANTSAEGARLLLSGLASLGIGIAIGTPPRRGG